MTTDKQRLKRINPIANEWATFLGIAQQWTVTIMFVDNIGNTSADLPAAAQIDTSSPYTQANITFRRSHVDHCDDIGLEQCIVHELIHILLEPANSKAKKMLGTDGTVYDELHDGFETLADTLTRIMTRLRDAKPPKGAKK